MKITLFTCLFLIITSYVSADYRQERARLMYSNPKYVENCTVFTARGGRNKPYQTNFTLTTLVPFTNNVTASVTLQMISGGDFRLSHKLCDIINEVWIINFMKVHSNIVFTCPFQPRTYQIYNMELPPKNMPIPMIASDYNIILELYVTSTKEQILKMLTVLRYEESKWKRA